MKLRTTTPASHSFLMRASLVVLVILLGFAVPMQLVSKFAFADQYDDKIRAIQQDINAYQDAANKLNAQAKTYGDALAVLNNQVAAIQKELDLSQAKYDQLQAQIADTEKKITENKDGLGTIIADMYVDDTVSPIEMLASSNNIGDYLDKQEYRSSIRDQLSATIKQIKELKTQLEKQKSDVEIVLKQQQAQRDSLAAKQGEQQNLYNQTKGEEAAYQNLVSSRQQALDDAAAQQRAYYESLGGGASSGVYGSFSYRNLSPGNGAGGCSGGYPYCQPQDSIVDPWDLYNRECVSYVAWALEQRFGKYVGGFSGQGNAYEWPSSAPRFSGAYRTYDPQPGDAVVLPQSGGFAPIGHLMIIESVGNDGWIHVSQFNFYGTGQYSTMDIRNSGVIYLRFQNRV
jgi:peptidoglycan hydrolase CwlO-like protein